MSPLLDIKNLSVDYSASGSFGAAKKFRAVSDVSLSLAQGQTLGLVGESGCGKSTLAKTICRLLSPTSGQIFFEGTDIATLRGASLLAYRRAIQMVFQDPADSLNPKHTIREIISEPLEIHHIPNRPARILELLDLVGLPSDFATRHPHELSGGQRQRVGIARALALSPKLIICDEPVSALDLSIQSQIINLLLSLQKSLNLSYLFISHDLRLVRHFSDSIAVMERGVLVEYGPAESVYRSPSAPYTKKLLASLPPV